ncbi:hypothetical protein DesLBE_1478 [Desulfitobacterium sp. LBE]|uniref:ATP-binding protein n=1 Tax=Desulfitobacterium sp. LBE TaxID=884086 RepID=UPI001198EE06|nr:ATP-binding protein [Desulfitobacterium sp. LBE]TWH57213.1 hypothetical protein DesLBE_1478 [Desulfitobacterium sp. LBE]
MLFEREDWKLFRNMETLPQKAGVPESKLSMLVCKELVDNALDLCGACEIGYEGDLFYVKDRGVGLDPDLFSISRPLRSSKYLRLPTRGALGNGLRVVAGAVAASGGRAPCLHPGQALQDPFPKGWDGSPGMLKGLPRRGDKNQL